MINVEEKIALFTKWRRDAGTEEAHVRRLQHLARAVAIERDEAYGRIAEIESTKQSVSKKTTKIQTDRFGSKPGTECHTINKALTTRPQTSLRIAEKTGLSVSRIHSHMSFLMNRGLVEKTDKGYKVKSNVNR